MSIRKGMVSLDFPCLGSFLCINYEIVWAIAKEELPGLLPRIRDILGKDGG